MSFEFFGPWQDVAKVPSCPNPLPGDEDAAG